MTQKNMGRKRVVSQEKQVAHIEQFDRKKPLLTRMAVKIITGMAAGKDEKKFVHNPKRMLCSDSLTYEFKIYF